MNVLIFGHVCIDHNVSERTHYTSAGSPAMFMTKIFRTLNDVKSMIISHRGENFLPYLNNVDTYPKEPNHDHTLVYYNIATATGRTQKTLFRDNSPPVNIDESLELVISYADVIIFSPLLPNFSASYIKDIVKLSKEDTLKIMSPQGYFREFNRENTVIFREFKEADDILPLVDFVILSDEDYPDIERIAHEWAKISGITIIITKAERGAEVISKDKQIDIPTNAVSREAIVDSTGSGDIFSAGFAYKYFHTKDVIESVHFANCLAGECLFLTPDEIESNIPRILDKDSLTNSKGKNEGER